jgi:WD40 repeat protein
VWGLEGLLPSSSGSSSNGLSSTGQLSRLLASHDTPAAVGAMAFDPMSELLCSGHKDGTVSVWNCSHSTQCSTIFE